MGTLRSGSGRMMKVGWYLLIAAAAWWLVKRVWLFREGTEVEPPVTADVTPPDSRDSFSGPDPVDEAIAESFPASDPPSYAGARGQDGSDREGRSGAR